ncbi:alpha-hydroxy-acid oxidizing protein [Blastococcus brunescens]|uniref:Alpha-hydroxy-acid oxidizing protein n=1 Tax=Blastococcus brunescens TaxID=1564165 RepID=A0ABZ1B9Z3_9ACTN|nr:alpha-hydroxy-acid oxidizing protein [Blastococcus sp. BMG 8361]WRL67277.1 alpha-hydroxy-acid oxidizing protein [Blastococcus sp. BMG 8361]
MARLLPGQPEVPAPRAAVETFLGIYSRPSITWDDLAWLRSRTRLPILLKGVLHPDDARRALDEGVDGLVVSTHGGRQVDRSISALDALPEVLGAVAGRAPVLLDSGIRSGADVFTAVALGATAVLLGRPFAWGLALAGEDGVRQVISDVVGEFDLTLGLTGHTAVDQLSPTSSAASAEPARSAAGVPSRRTGDDVGHDGRCPAWAGRLGGMPPPSAGRRRWDLLVVGAGTAGLIGAQTVASLGARVLLVEPTGSAATGCGPDASRPRRCSRRRTPRPRLAPPTPRRRRGARRRRGVLAHVRRAIFSRLVVDGRHRIRDATVVGPRAGEALAEFTLAVIQGLSTSDLTSAIHPYPPYADPQWNAAIGDARGRLAHPAARVVIGGLLLARRALLATRR